MQVQISSKRRCQFYSAPHSSVLCADIALIQKALRKTVDKTVFIGLLRTLAAKFVAVRWRLIPATVLVIALAVSLANRSEANHPTYRPELCGFDADHPLWAAITYMGQDNAALRLQAARVDQSDAHLRGTPSDYAAASINYDVLLGYLAREVYLCSR